MTQPSLRDSPLVVTRGQAAALFLQDEAGRRYILKKFLLGHVLDSDYLEAIAHLVPQDAGFQAATDRRILSSVDIGGGGSGFQHPAFPAWIDGTVLMPRVEGLGWESIADDLRDGDLILNREQRLELVRSLAELVALMESNQCAHRDLSCGNVMIDLRTWTIRLIDFDSFFHPTLKMPAQTTCGTAGYAAPWSWQTHGPTAGATWEEGADRFPLAILIAELLALDQGAPLVEEGGLFEQDHLRARAGTSLQYVRSRIAALWPDFAGMLDRALFAPGITGCPSPTAWVMLAETLLGNRQVPKLDDISIPDFDRVAAKLAREHPALPIWPAPRISDIQLPALKVKRHGSATTLPHHPLVTLPENPWCKTASRGRR